MGSSPKLRLVGERLAPGLVLPLVVPLELPLVPVPDNEMVRVEHRAAHPIEMLPETRPVTSGWNSTVKVVLPLTPRARGNANPLMLKPAPCTLACETWTLRGPLLVRVTACVLLPPTVTLPKLMLLELELSCASDPAAHLEKQRTAINENTKRAGGEGCPALGIFGGFSIWQGQDIL
jgi:hypothetical protein